MKNTSSGKKPMGRLLKATIWVVCIIVIFALTAAVFQKQILTAVATKIIQQRFANQSQKYDDGMLFSLPVNNDKILVRNLLK